MVLSAATRLGPYEILGLIGAGGMGEVYKAKDTRLARIVAIKVLSADVSADPDHRARFEREARAIAGLSHPHICTLHDVGEHASSLFLVMEHLEGETLADRLAKGALSIEQALEIGAQIADALAAAHRHGIIHRDLKPANVMLTKSGVKLLDFGLAKPVPQPAGFPGVSAITQSKSLTAQRTIVGTLQYMAPEQLEGRPVDARTDLWALGAILYEMVTGRRAFEAKSAARLIGAILEREPAPLAMLQPLTPPALDRLVRQCLAKSPDDRPDTAHDVAGELRWAREAGGDMGDTRHSAIASSRWLMPLGVGSLLLAGVLALVALGRGLVVRPPTPARPVHVTIPLKTEPIETSGQYAHIAISPDGQIVVFKEDSALVRRPLNTDASAVIEGTQNARFPAFKPDSGAIAFYDASAGHIKRVATSGGPVTDVAIAAISSGIAWGDDDQLYFSAGLGTGISRIPATGGKPEPVTRVDDAAGESAHTWPQPLPGGKALLFTALGPSGGATDARVLVQVIGSQERRTLADHAMFGRYVESGHLIFARNDGTVYAVAFDPDRLETTGTPVSVLSGVGTATWGGAAFLAVSNNGTLAFVKPAAHQDVVFRLVEADGRSVSSSALGTGSIANLGPYVDSLRVAPDGRRYAVTRRDSGVADVWLLDAQSGEAERVTFDVAEDEFPVWRRDGKAIAYTSAQTGSARRIFVKTIESGAAPTLVSTWPRHAHVSSWSPDGRWLALYDYTETNSRDIWAIPLDGNDKIGVANTAASEIDAQFSPDGRWLAYVSNESGRSEVYVVSFPALSSRRQVSTDGGVNPRWDAEGRVLYYLQRGYLVGHDVRLGTEFGKGRATRLFATEAQAFDIAPGHRFAVGEPSQSATVAPLNLILNWFEELRAKVPGK